MPPFKVVSDFEPAGDQPKAIAALAEGVDGGHRFQTLLGITGSGKSATIAWTIEQVQRPTLVHRPEQVAGRPAGQRVPRVLPATTGSSTSSATTTTTSPRRTCPSSDTYIEKDTLDQRRDRPAAPLGHLRPAHPAGRRSSSRRCRCIYGLGSPEEYREQLLDLHAGRGATTSAPSCASSSTCSTSATT